MGRASDRMIEEQENAAMEEWIREQLDDYGADEDTEGWQELVLEYDELVAQGMIPYEYSHYEEYEDYWDIEGKTKYEIFTEIIDNSTQILNIPIKNEHIGRNLYVMLFGHIVAAVEAYLSSTFIETVMSSDEYIRKLVETDPTFANQKFTMKEIFTKREELKNDVKRYLLDIIFHDIKKVKPMYKSVLNIGFGDVEWLFKAIVLRHDCVHRAGYDKDGSEIDITKEKVETLIAKCKELIDSIELEKNNLPEPQEDDFK